MPLQMELDEWWGSCRNVSVPVVRRYLWGTRSVGGLSADVAQFTDRLWLTRSDRHSPNVLCTLIAYSTIGEARASDYAISTQPHFLSVLSEKVVKRAVTVPRPPTRSRVWPSEPAPDAARSNGDAPLQKVSHDD